MFMKGNSSVKKEIFIFKVILVPLGLVFQPCIPQRGLKGIAYKSKHCCKV